MSPRKTVVLLSPADVKVGAVWRGRTVVAATSVMTEDEWLIGVQWDKEPSERDSFEVLAGMVELGMKADVKHRVDNVFRWSLGTNWTAAPA